MRGHGHSIYGQTLVKGGIVIQMSTLSKARNLPGARVLADAGCSWGAVLEETLKEGATPPVIPDYLGLSVGGTLSIGGISPTTYRYGSGGDTVVLRGTKYYSPPATPDDAAMLAGLNFVPGVMQIDDLTYLENFSITTGPFPPLRHPAICVVLPASAATQYIQGVLPRLTDADLGSYNVAQIFTWRASRFGQPLMRVPAEEKLVGFALLRFAQDAEEGERMLAGNRQLFEESRALGGTLYPFSAVKLSRSDWRQHYGEDFDELARAKRRYDRRNVLASGPDSFQVKN